MEIDGVIVDDKFDKIQELNLDTFNRWGTSDPETPRYVCCICGRPASVDNSYSKRGDRLVHTTCFRGYIPGNTSSDKFKWVFGEEY